MAGQGGGSGPTRDQRKRTLCLYVLARGDFEQARRMAELAEETQPEPDSALYWAFNTAIVIAYARPFVETRGQGNLSGRWRRFNDPRLTEAHRSLLRLRHKFVAHSDAEARNVMVWTPGARVAELQLDHARIRTKDSVTDAAGLTRTHGVMAETQTIDIGSYVAVTELCDDLLGRLVTLISRELPSLYPQYVPVAFPLSWSPRD